MKRTGDAKRTGHWRGLAIIAVVGLVAAACGGGSDNAKTTETTQSLTEESTTTTTVDGNTTVPGETTTSLAPGATTSSTVRRTTTTAKRNPVAPKTGNIATAAPKAGIGNVEATTSTAPRADIQPGGTLTWLKAGEIPTLDPAGQMANSGASDGPGGFAVFDMLFYTEQGQVKGHTAQSLTSGDGITWTLKLQPNIRFSDGTAYDANAVIFNWRRIQNTAAATRKPQADQMANMEALDAVTIKITLKAKNALFPGNLALMPFVGSPKAIDEKKDAFGREPVGAGPYLMKSWQRDAQMVLERNPSYWDAPRPYIDRLILKPIIDETSRLNTFCSGEAQLLYVGAVTNADDVNKKKCGNINPLVLNGGTDLFFNQTKAPMNNANLRKAISMALDPEDYSKVVTQGLIGSTKSMFRPDSPFHDPTILQGPFDKVKAQELFTKAAAELGVNTIEIPMTTFQVLNYQNTAQYVQGKVNEYQHVKINLITESSTQHITNCSTKAYTGICVFGTIFDDPDPTFTGVFTCSASTNYTGYCNTEFDKLVAHQQQTLDPNERVADWKNIQKILYADPPVHFVEQRYSWVFSAPGIQDFAFVNDGLPLLDRFWLKTH